MNKKIRNLDYQLKKVIYKFIKNDGITVLVSLILFYFLVTYHFDKKDIINSIDFSIITTIILAIIVGGISKFINWTIGNYLEDENKLTVDYDKLTSRYVNGLYKYTNSIKNGVTFENFYVLTGKLDAFNHTNNTLEVTFPITHDAYTYKVPIQITDSHNKYNYPEEIKDNINDLMRAHDTSTTYNQLNIRVDDWHMEDTHFQLHTSRTTYLQSLMTNRAMDYVWSNGLTNRELYDYGPFITPLKDSKLSNHLGFSGFIESSDGFIPLIKRKSSVSLGKRNYAPSITASLKAKFALDNNENLSLTGLENGIKKEIHDELKISEEDLLWEDTSEHIFSFYRDMVEGGKPHFLFYVKTTKSKIQIEQEFTRSLRKKSKNIFNLQERMLEDGDKIIWINKKHLTQIAISPQFIVNNGIAYKTAPSYSFSLAMLITHLKKINYIT